LEVLVIVFEVLFDAIMVSVQNIMWMLSTFIRRRGIKAAREIDRGMIEGTFSSISQFISCTAKYTTFFFCKGFMNLEYMF